MEVGSTDVLLQRIIKKKNDMQDLLDDVSDHIYVEARIINITKINSMLLVQLFELSRYKMLRVVSEKKCVVVCSVDDNEIKIFDSL